MSLHCNQYVALLRRTLTTSNNIYRMPKYACHINQPTNKYTFQMLRNVNKIPSIAIYIDIFIFGAIIRFRLLLRQATASKAARSLSECNINHMEARIPRYRDLFILEKKPDIFFFCNVSALVANNNNKLNVNEKCALIELHRFY